MAQLKAVFKETIEKVRKVLAYETNPEERKIPSSFDIYEKLKEEVLRTVKVKNKTDEYGNEKIVAYYCETPEQLDLVIKYKRHGEDVPYSSSFKGADWYFFTHIDVSPDRHYIRYESTVETLTEKKKAFKKFVEEFENNTDRSNVDEK